MKLTLSGKEFTLRCDMRCLATAKREAGIDLATLGNDLVECGTLVYYMAQSGAKYAGIPFEYSLDEFFALIDVKDIDHLSEVMTLALGVGDGKKK